ncbi:MAG TPA: ribonuclease Z [Methanoregulaceae archaeon]|nr:ribonuclease Z [Methanoregulaceae archaeon]HQJ87307.1 ribonuclease Z [Methanoregulaceae archaeon]
MAGETLQVYFLGTAGALPTVHRNPACFVIRRGSDTLLFDCGEGAQQQMMRAQTGFGVDAVFITHWHADHFLGLFGLVQTMAFNGREAPLPLYGPDGVGEIVHIIEHLSTATMKFPVIGHVLRPGDEVAFDGYRVRAFATRHGMQSLGFVLMEDGRPGRFDREGAIALGVRPGPLFGRLQRGETVTVSVNGEEREIRPEQVLGPARPGRSVAYTGDTRFVDLLRAGVPRGVDLLIHDATYDDADRERAAEVHHATAGEAGEAATRVGARRLALVHLSSRYPSTAGHLRDATNAFSGEVLVPDDLVMIEIPFQDR